LLAARAAAAEEINGLVLDKKKEEYMKRVESYVDEQRRIQNKMDALRQMSDVSPKWQPLILDRVRTLSEGWSVVERGINEPLLDKELEYWKGTLESFLHS